MRLEIQATVMRMLQMTGVRQPASVQVTAADVARGYVDVPDAVVFNVKTNNPEGYAVHLQLVGVATSSAFADADTQLPPFRAAAANWETQTLAFGQEGAIASFQKPGIGMALASHHLGFRLSLAAGSAPGVYGWPVSLYVTPA